MLTKCILSMRVARDLLAKGCKMIDVDTSTARPGNVVFIFEVDEHFNQALAEISQKGR